MKKQNICSICNYNNPINNFICEAEDCGAPMDISIEIDKNGLPNIIN
tara:strand:+ start:1703 stop:1843 length:141 start_codon:yes stop_codon:yes gene_type:complete